MSKVTPDREFGRGDYKDWLQQAVTKDAIQMLIQLRDTHLIFTMGASDSDAMARLVSEAKGLNIAIDFLSDLGTPTEEEEEEEKKRKEEMESGTAGAKDSN